MSKGTSIEWTQRQRPDGTWMPGHSFNGWWGCVEAGAECDRCYARTFSHRLGKDLWGKDAPRRHASESYWKEPLRWNDAARKAGERHAVFAFSMGDIMEDRRDLDEARNRTWELIEKTESLDWLVLTKRPRGFAELTPPHWRLSPWWPRNLWAGTTCGTKAGIARVQTLIDSTPGIAVRFISAEPLLEPLDFDDRPLDPASTMGPWSILDQIHWVIAGSESGHGARKTETDWVRSLRDQAAAAGSAFFYKQGADARGRAISTPPLDGRVWREFPA